jgi:hypothetical protein
MRRPTPAGGDVAQDKPDELAGDFIGAVPNDASLSFIISSDFLLSNVDAEIHQGSPTKNGRSSRQPGDLSRNFAWRGMAY